MQINECYYRKMGLTCPGPGLRENSALTQCVIMGNLLPSYLKNEG